ncbi:MAG TPA: hypothetical protein VLE50_09120 [Cellvibrio sp.]|nr:hypothetical protein [Cellvibrio sp.]
MKWFQTVICSVLTLSLIACDGGEARHTAHEVYDGPILYGFDIYDSFGIDSGEDHSSPLQVDPYENGGWFELYWDVESSRDYTVVLGINDSPSMRGATIIGSDLCGAGLSCGLISTFVCRYTLDSFLGCGLVDEEAELNLEPVDHLLFEFPQPLYINIEVCDVAGGGCEPASLPVWLY